MDHMLGHKTSLSKFRKIEIISESFMTRNQLQGKNCRKKTPHKHMEAKQYATKQLMGHRKKIKEEIKKKIPGDKWKLKHNNPNSATKEAIIHNGEKTASSINGVGKTG